MESKQQQTAAGGEAAGSSNTGVKIAQVLKLQGFPRNTTNEKLAALLEEHKIANIGCQVELQPTTNQCEQGFASISFANRADCNRYQFST